MLPVVNDGGVQANFFDLLFEGEHAIVFTVGRLPFAGRNLNRVARLVRGMRRTRLRPGALLTVGGLLRIRRLLAVIDGHDQAVLILALLSRLLLVLCRLLPRLRLSLLGLRRRLLTLAVSVLIDRLNDS